MPNNRRIIKDGQIIDNQWLIIDDISEIGSATSVIVPLALWHEHKEQLAQYSVGLLLQNDQDLSELADELSTFDVIAIHFPVFMDGRGFSLARLLRDRYQYKGEIRATGAFIRDQLCYLKRSGFTAFDCEEDIVLEAAVKSLNDFSDGYQTSADQSVPLFRRKA